MCAAMSLLSYRQWLTRSSCCLFGSGACSVSPQRDWLCLLWVFLNGKALLLLGFLFEKEMVGFRHMCPVPWVLCLPRWCRGIDHGGRRLSWERCTRQPNCSPWGTCLHHQARATTWGMATLPTGGGVHLAEVWQSGSGLVCLWGVDPLSPHSYIFTGAGCHGTEIAKPLFVCLSSDSSAHGSSSKGSPRLSPPIICVSLLANLSLVLGN